MEIRVLGPVEVGVEGELVALGGPKQRALFALLVAAVPDLGSADGLIDGLWGEEASPGSRSTLQTYVSNLRQVLGDVLVHERGGYRLVVDPAVIDAVEFTRALEEARVGLATDPEKVAVGLRRVLALWRGRPYADLVDVPGLESETRRLEALRLEAVELRIDAELACGRHSEVLAELEALAEEHPTREHFRAQHMLALYRAGRQADALRAYRRSEAFLAETLGVDPSQELQDLELRILDHDESLRFGGSRAVTQRLAFLVSEIEGSARLWDRFPQAMATALADHDRILGEAIEEAGGRVVKHTGERAVAVFPDAVAAVAAAEAMLSRLAGTDWGEIGELRVRLGVDVGEAEARGDDFYGPPLNRASRLCAIGHGGQVLLSSAAERDVTASAPPGLQVRHLGEVPLRGMAAPERVSQLVFSGLPADFPDLRLDAASGLDHGAEALSLPGYEVREPIGEGRFGVVWRAYQPSVGREVAVKIVRPEFAGRPSFVRRFEAEARTVARLAHPHIVPLIDFWRDATGAYLVLQLLEGGSLRETLSAGSLDKAARRRILHQVGAALDHAHAHGVIHGDFQPDNILLDEAGNAYLSDFGIAARLVDLELVASMSSAPAFRAPEEPRSGPTKAADLFAFGMLARHLLGDHPELEELLARATSPTPSDRYPSASAILTDLDEALGQQAPVVEPPAVSRNPYKGLRAFDESDAPDFHGRDELVATLTGALSRHRFVTVVGPSGSGKSSAVRAGLLPALADGAVEGSDRWFRTVLTPGTQPLESLLEALEALAPGPAELLGSLENGDLAEATDRLLGDADSELVIVVDQFEEIFTLADDPRRRDAFLDLLVQGVQAEESRVRVVATLRADFYDRPLEYEGLDRLVRDGLVTVLRPSPEELLEMISRPAQAVGLRWEPGLPHRIAQEVVDQPGGLPLLQYALTELVERRRGDLLTDDDYQRTGGVAAALVTRAEAVFGELAPSRQEAARQMLLRLVTIDEDAEATRRRVRRSELESLGIDREDLEPVLEAFTTERLLLADRDPITRGPTIEVAHEALLREWPRLRSWVDDQRDVLLLGRRLRVAMTEWEESDRDPGYLLTGSRLAPFLAWAESPGLSHDEKVFLATSQDKDQAERAARARRRRTLTSILATAAVVAIVLATVALAQRERARANEELATARELAASAINTIGDDPELSILLALEAAHIADPPPEAIKALHRAVQTSRTTCTARLAEGTPMGASVSAAITSDGEQLLLTGDGRSVDLWDVNSCSRQTIFGTSVGGEDFIGLAGLALSPDERYVATVSEEAIHLWDIESGVDRGFPLPRRGSIPGSVAFSPDGSRLATVTASGRGPPADQITLWDLATAEQLASWTLEGFTVHIHFDRDRLIVADVITNQIYALDPVSGSQTAIVQSDIGLEAASPSPDGRMIAVGGLDTQAHLYDADTGREIRSFRGHTGTVRVAKFAPGGRHLVTTSADSTVRIWDLASGHLLMTLAGHGGNILSLSFTADGTRVASASSDRTARVWDVTKSRVGEVAGFDLGDAVTEVEVQGDRVAALVLEAGASSTGPAVVLDLSTRQQMSIPQQVSTRGPNLGAAVALSPDGQTLVSQTGILAPDGSLEGLGPIRAHAVWSGEPLLVLEGICPDTRRAEECGLPPDLPFQEEATTLTFSPDGSLVAGAGYSGAVSLWDAGSGQLIAVAPGISPLGVARIAFHPDGTLLAVAGGNGPSTVLSVPSLDKVAELDTDFTLGIQFSPDGSLLAASSAINPPKIFESETWSTVRELPVVGSTWTLDFNDEGTLLATAGADGLIHVWEVSSGQELQAIPVEAGETAGVSFLSDDRHILVGSREGSLLVLTRDTNELLDIARSRLFRGLSEEECQTYLQVETCPPR